MSLHDFARNVIKQAVDRATAGAGTISTRRQQTGIGQPLHDQNLLPSEIPATGDALVWGIDAWGTGKTWGTE